MVRRTIIAAIFAATLSTPGATSAGGDQIGRIKSTLDTTSIERSSASLAVSVGTGLIAGDWLVTGKDGKLGITFVDNTRFSVGPDSRIALKQFEYDPTTQKGTFIAQVERGSIAVVSGRMTKGGRDGMQIETPDSVIDVQGTRFIVVVPK